MVKEKVCSTCRRFVYGNVCPACKISKLTRNWQGSVVILNPDSEIAQTLGISAPASYATSVSKLG